MSNYLNRELSWLEFNQRVLEEAQDPTQPLLERLKFLTIVSSNLDEFFEIRVAALKQLLENRSDAHGPDGLRPGETLAVYVILDLEYPRLGLIRVDAADALLKDLRSSWGP